MATSPRNELVIESVVVFARLERQWVWSENTPDALAVTDSGHGVFSVLDDAVEDYFRDKGVDPNAKVPAEQAHWSKLSRVSDDQYDMRRYKHGAPDPYQAVTA